MNKKTIFVQIPSYRDWELPKTIDNCIRQSSGNNEIRFGVHNCVAFKDEIFVAPKPNVSIATSIAPCNVGLQKSRYIANEFYDGEDYYLQIDSHTRFVQNWDEVCIDAISKYQNMGIAKPLVTQYPPNYGYDDNGEETYDEILNFKQIGIWFGQDVRQFETTLIPTQTARILSIECGFTKSVSGGNIFTVGEFSKIKPNKKIAFWGEELLIAARAFTHGFDLVMPFDHSIFHLYNSNQSFTKVRRHNVWRDFPELWQEIESASKTEYLSIFTERRVSDDALGNERTLKEFEEFAGLNFVDKTIKL